VIKISVDEAYVFDMLSIFDVKIKKLSGEKLALTLEKFSDMVEEVIDQIGKEKFDQIYTSNEYKELVEANQRIFDLVDESQKIEGMAKVTDDANFARHLKKMNLQKAHFNNDLTEVKNRE
jgi:copper homeostasis protein CutC